LTADSYTACKNRALRILGIRQFSVKELSERLSEKGEATEDIEKTIAALIDLRFLDDEKYAESIVRRYAAKGYGRPRITAELYRRGIDRELWDAAFDAALPDGEQTADKIDELLHKKLPENPEPSDIRKAAAFLARRGYSRTDIKAALERLSQED